MSSNETWSHEDAWACSQLIARLAVLTDRAQWSEFGTVLHRDASVLAFGTELQGVDAVTAFFSERLTGRVVRHVLAPSLIEPTAAGARAATYLTVYFAQPGTREPPHAMTGPAMVVEYFDDFVRSPAGWLMTRHEVHVIMRRAD